MKRRSLLLVLCLCACLLVATLTVSAAEAEESGTCGENLTWTLDSDGVLTVSGTGEMSDYSESRGAPWGREIKAVVMESGVTSIGKSAFAHCENLTSAVIPEGVTSIGNGAFYGCKSLTSIIIPEGVTSIGNSVLSYCSALTSVVLPSTVTTVAPYAFEYCTALTSVTLSEGLTTVGFAAFEHCTALEEITLPQSLTTIEEVAFYGCSALKEITIPENVESISSQAFTWCKSLTAIRVAAGNRAYSADEKGVLFNKEKTELVRCPERFVGAYIIPDGAVTLHSNAFMNCGGLTDITIPEGVAEFEGASFQNCVSLKSVTIPKSMRKSGSGAFSGCTALTEVTICEGISEISNKMFQGCTALKQISIPESVTRIDGQAFSGCTALTSVTIPKNVTNIGWNAFEGCTGLTSVTIPEGVTYIGVGAFSNCTELSAIWVDANNTAYYSDAVGVLYNKEKTELIQAPAKARLGDYVVPEGVTSIGNVAFNGCKNLTSVTIPESVTYIGGGEFRGCDELIGIWVDKNNTTYCSDEVGVLYNKEKTELIHVPRRAKLGDYVIPEGVTTVGSSYEGGFDGCTELTSITIPASVTKIDYWVFSGCTELSAIWVDADNTAYSSDARGILYNKEKTALVHAPAKAALGDYSVPAGVTRIMDQAFTGCKNLTSITIPEGVETIYYMAFSSCTNLKKVILPSTATDIHDYVFMGCTALESINLQEGMTKICGYTFTDCSSLKSIDIPASVTGIGIGAFRGCTNLESVVMPEGVSYIYAMAFGNCVNLKTVCFRGDAPKTFSYLVFQIYDANEENIGSEDGVNIPGLTLYYIEGKDGWTTPEWNGYPTMTWDGVNVPKGHEHDYKATVTAPTCTEKGYTTYVCACGSSYVADEVAVLGHAWDEGKITTAPTTEKEGVRTFTCTRCELTRTEPIDKLQASVSFKDVDETAYYAAAVEWAVAKNITKGTAADTFAPNDTCTRGQIVTFLWRAAGEPKPSGAKNPFTDVKQSDYWYNAVLWAVEQGITTGTSATTFSPNEGCTRGQVATFLWRYENKPASAAVNPFEDVKIGAYYYDAVLWAVEADVTKGTSATTFAPNDTCTRGQIVTFLYRDIA